jgi:3'-phosphoadenosine 5'-phosphosulfate sulfotransferase (PAPS reductase)/FAD synthetase
MPMPERWRRTFLAYANGGEHARKVTNARQRIAAFLADRACPYLAYSGGKDSTAMLHLVAAVDPDIVVMYSDNGPDLVPRVIHDEVLDVARAAGARDLRVLRPLNVDEVARQGYDGVFVGLREQESTTRRTRMRAGRWFGPIPECWPLSDWSWRDVWGYLVAHDVRYVSMYDEIAPVVGYDSPRSRFHTFFDPKFEDVGATTLDGVLHWRLRGR